MFQILVALHCPMCSASVTVSKIAFREKIHDDGDLPAASTTTTKKKPGRSSRNILLMCIGSSQQREPELLFFPKCQRHLVTN
jgi:hypothetical protein